MLLAVAFLLVGERYYQNFVLDTKPVAAYGGKYEEAIAGEAKYINPILAQSDAELGISRLLFSGLVSVINSERVVPDLAEKWEISSDGKTYTFHLKKGNFSDGRKLTSQDFIFTLERIKNPDLKSPLSQAFLNVGVSAPDDSTLIFSLPNPYGPFIYYCNFGVLPATISDDEFSKHPVGSGPFKFEKLVKDGSKIKEIYTTRNDEYAGDKPYLNEVVLKLYSDEAGAKTGYEKNKNSLALFGPSSGIGKQYNYSSSRRLGLIFNLRGDKLKDDKLRLSIINGEKLPTPLALNLTTLDVPMQRAKAEELKRKFKEQNIDLTVMSFTPSKLSNVLSAKNYELLLYGFDFGFDRDPFKFWHSSQIENQNFAGWSDKASDILLEEARMTADSAARNSKYDQFFDIVKSKGLAIYFDPIIFNFSVKENVWGVEKSLGNQPYSRLELIPKWYVKERRVRK